MRSGDKPSLALRIHIALISHAPLTQPLTDNYAVHRNTQFRSPASLRMRRPVGGGEAICYKGSETTRAKEIDLLGDSEAIHRGRRIDLSETTVHPAETEDYQSKA